MNIYDFKVKDVNGNDFELSNYKGKVLLIINSATKCGLTPQYGELEKLYEKFDRSDFEILDFPCNQFKEQAPESDQEIASFCSLTYGTTFPRFKKIEVNGENADELYKWLKSQAKEDAGDDKTAEFKEMIMGIQPIKDPTDILWNFGKFLIDKNGNVVERFAPNVEPVSLSKNIEKLI
ncbi:MAG: glutathione peroxidase [Bacilli bacterium]